MKWLSLPVRSATLVWCLCMAVLASVPALASLSRDQLADHWLPERADRAALATLAAAIWHTEARRRTIEADASDAPSWQVELDAVLRTLRRLDQEALLRRSGFSDGQLASWLSEGSFTQTDPNWQGASAWLRDEVALSELARASHRMALHAPQIWAEVTATLTAWGLDGAAEVRQWWQAQSLEALSTEALAHGRAQVQRSQNQQWISLMRHQAEWLWAQGEPLPALWWWMEGLHRLRDAPNRDEAVAYRRGLRARTGEDLRRLRELDVDSPVVMALLEDAADRLVNGDTAAAAQDLNDALMRLALFAPSQAFYLDQPVREDITALWFACRASDWDEPPPDEVYASCLQQWFDLAQSALNRPELVGSDGPYAVSFLQRELGLVSWQRVAYLDGYLGWRLSSRCQLVSWINPVEFALVVEAIARWLPLQPRWQENARWRDELHSLQAQAEVLQAQRRARMDCLSGLGADRTDPLARLFDRHQQALDRLDERLQLATQRFYAEHTRPGADLDLEGEAGQSTAYRPAQLMVRPCADGNSCGARVELPVSNALLARIPTVALLADQLALGTLNLCYDEVHWADRERRPSRSGDPRVANYFGRLSLRLQARFEHEGGQDVIFSQTLVAEQPRHYFFAAADDEVLALDCVHGLGGQPIASQLSEDALGLVPDRLTYFTSLPTSADAQLVANWTGGEGWQAQLAMDEAMVPAAMTAWVEAVDLRLDELLSRRERQLAARLTSPLDLDQHDELTQAMAEVAETSALLRRTLEIHYPRLIRHDPLLRSAAVGEQALLNRDRVRMIRDRAERMGSVPTLGHQRLASMQAHWQTLPAPAREHGHSSPELDRALAQLRELLKRDGVFGAD